MPNTNKGVLAPRFMRIPGAAVLAAALLGLYGAMPSSGQLGNVTYTLNQASNPTTDQSDAYAKIKIAMDSATLFYNTFTSIPKKLSISYEPSVPTTDGNINGSIRFGSNRSYMICCTAMHEIAHTVGIGTISAWSKLIVNGRYIGTNANKEFRTIIGNPDTVLKGDSQHFWPYGLNYASEVKSTADYINHARIVNAMQKDFYPNIVSARLFDHGPRKVMATMNSAGVITYSIPVSCVVEIRLYTLSGRTVAIVNQGKMEAGEHAADMNASALPQGLYVCGLTSVEYENGVTALIATFSARLAR